MNVSKLDERASRLVNCRGWGLWFRVLQWMFAVICLALIAFSFSKFKGYPDYHGWQWGPIGIAFVSLLIDDVAYTRLLGP